MYLACIIIMVITEMSNYSPGESLIAVALLCVKYQTSTLLVSEWPTFLLLFSRLGYALEKSWLVE